MHKGRYLRVDGSGDFYYVLLMKLICLSAYPGMKLSWRQGSYLIQIIFFSKLSPALAHKGQLEFAEWMMGHSEEKLRQWGRRWCLNRREGSRISVVSWLCRHGTQTCSKIRKENCNVFKSVKQTNQQTKNDGPVGHMTSQNYGALE